jgi:hypothetical protein
MRTVGVIPTIAPDSATIDSPGASETRATLWAGL